MQDLEHQTAQALAGIVPPKSRLSLADRLAEAALFSTCAAQAAALREASIEAAELASAQLTVRNLPEIPEAFEHRPLAPSAFTGFDVGPFFVHQGISDREDLIIADDYDEADLWHVVHRATGFAVQKRIPNLARGIWLAKKLIPLHTWIGTKDEILSSMDAELRAQISVLRADAVDGDCQGEFARDEVQPITAALAAVTGSGGAS